MQDIGRRSVPDVPTSATSPGKRPLCEWTGERETGKPGRMPVVAVAIGAVAFGYWMFIRRRDAAVDAQTRKRLCPPTRPVPNANDIVVR
ncbi:hypothetical protein ACAX61_02125 [Sphingomonas sp. IW22]